MTQENKQLIEQATERRRAFLRSLGKWSQVVIYGTVGGGLLMPRMLHAVNWNDCPSNNNNGDNGPPEPAWLNSSGSGGQWINSADTQIRLQGGDSGDPPQKGQGQRRWMNGNRDGWTNRQGCSGGTWVNF